jgi:hypothetical protein
MTLRHRRHLLLKSKGVHRTGSTPHALRVAVGVGADIVDAYVGNIVHRDVEHAKWRLWHGRWRGCLIKLAGVYRWTKAKSTANVEGVRALRRHLRHLIAYLEANRSGLVNYGARYRRHELISTGFVESSINEIIARSMTKKQQMRWNRWTVQPFLDVRVAVLDGTLEDSFRKMYPGFRSASDHGPASAAA